MTLRPVDGMLDATEKDLLVGFLQAQRDAIVSQVEGLSDDSARRRLVPSLTTPIGVVNHLVGVEAWWFRVIFAGEDDVPLTWTDEDRDADFRAEGRSLDAVVAAYRQAWEASDAIVLGAALDDRSRRDAPRRGDQATLRWILLHMIEETARHAGHVDILREQIDAER